MNTFLHKLWDETLAGPTPDTGLGKLRKYDSLSAAESPPVKISKDIPVTRSITILRSNSDFRSNSDDRSRRMIDLLAGESSPRTPSTRELFSFRIDWIHRLIGYICIQRFLYIAHGSYMRNMCNLFGHWTCL